MNKREQNGLVCIFLGLDIYHVHVYGMLGRSFGELFQSVWSKTAQYNIFSGSFEKNGPEFNIRLSGNSSTHLRTESVNAGVIMVVSNIIDFWDTYWKTLVWISGC